MSKKKESYTVIPVEEKEMEERQNGAEETDQVEQELEEKFDKDFWLKASYQSLKLKIFDCLLYLVHFCLFMSLD